tara:strand:+ start:399 stop:689 length:291 start_codon:yes stop_codon:yes gene_type:complete
MKTKTKTIYLHAVVYEGESEIYYYVSDSAMEFSPEYMLCDSQEITFELPDPDSVMPLVIKGLQEKRGAMVAASSAAIQEVDNQIASLMAIPNLSEA